MWNHSYLAHSTLRIRWSYPNPDTPAMALDASSRRWKLIKANPCEEKNEDILAKTIRHLPQARVTTSTDLWLPSVLVLGQVDPWDGTKWSKEFLQVRLTGVLGQIGHANSCVVISCWRANAYMRISVAGQTITKCNDLNAPLRLGCIDSPLRVPPSLRLGGTYFPVLLCAGCTGSGSATQGEWGKMHQKSAETFFEWTPQQWTGRTRASRLILVCSGKAELFCQLLLHWAQGVLIRTAGGPMVTFANTTGHNLLSFNFIHGVLILVLGIQILKKQ